MCARPCNAHKGPHHALCMVSDFAYCQSFACALLLMSLRLCAGPVVWARSATLRAGAGGLRILMMCGVRVCVAMRWRHLVLARVVLRTMQCVLPGTCAYIPLRAASLYPGACRAPMQYAMRCDHKTVYISRCLQSTWFWGFLWLLAGAGTVSPFLCASPARAPPALKGACRRFCRCRAGAADSVPGNVDGSCADNQHRQLCACVDNVLWSWAYMEANACAHSAAPDLAKGISDILGLPLGKATIARFNDGECNIQAWPCSCGLCLPLYRLRPAR